MPHDPKTYRYLSNWFAGRLPRDVEALRRCTTAKRRLDYLRSSASETALIWSLHHARDQTPMSPRQALLYAEAAVDLCSQHESDIQSWSYSTRGSLRHRLLLPDAAADHLRALDLAESPHQLAHAMAVHSVFVSPLDPIRALNLTSEALQMAQASPPHFNSDRGITGIESAHISFTLQNGLQFEDCCQRLLSLSATACKRHARNSRLTCLANLAELISQERASLSENLYSTAYDTVLAAYRNLDRDHYNGRVVLVPKTKSLPALMIRLALERIRVAKEGWTIHARDRYKTIHLNLLALPAPRQAIFVTGEMAARDVATGRPVAIQRALKLLKDSEPLYRSTGDQNEANWIASLAQVKLSDLQKDLLLRKRLQTEVYDHLRHRIPKS